MKRKKTRKRKTGPLSAIGWKRAYHNPKTGKELSGAWVHPDSRALQHVAQNSVIAQGKRVFRDTQVGLRSAKKVGLV